MITKIWKINGSHLCDYSGKSKQVTIPKRVDTINSWAFLDADNLKSLKFQTPIKWINCEAFFNIPKIKPQYNKNGTLRAFKAFNADWKCRGFQYEVGKSYHQNGKIECCENGFHACTSPLDVFNYYWGDLTSMHFAEVELSGKVVGLENKVDSKVAASDIKIVRELTFQDLVKNYNKMEKI